MWCPNVAVTASHWSGTAIAFWHGDLLNQRLDGADTKESIGKPGLETAYKVKQFAQAIKKSAAEFAAEDETFLSLVRRAMQGEAETVGKRFAGKLS